MKVVQDFERGIPKGTWVPLQMILVSSGSVGKVTDGSSTKQSVITVRCRMPSNTSTIQGDSCVIAYELCHLTTIHKQAQEQECFSLCFAAEANDKVGGGGLTTLCQMELGLRPAFCHSTSTVTLRYK